MKPVYFYAACALALGSPAHADDDPAYDRFFVIPNVGTLGAGVEAGYDLDDAWRLRLGINGLKTAFVYHDNHSDLHSNLKLLSGGITFDYFPTAENFYLAGGVRLSGNTVSGSLKNLKYKRILVIEPLTDYSVRQNSIQPYLGAGYTLPINERVSLNFDLGALYAGTPDLSVNTRLNQFFTREQIRREIERQQDRISPYRFLPVVQIGLKVNF